MARRHFRRPLASVLAAYRRQHAALPPAPRAAHVQRVDAALALVRELGAQTASATAQLRRGDISSPAAAGQRARPQFTTSFYRRARRAAPNSKARALLHEMWAAGTPAVSVRVSVDARAQTGAAVGAADEDGDGTAVAAPAVGALLLAHPLLEDATFRWRAVLLTQRAAHGGWLGCVVNSAGPAAAEHEPGRAAQVGARA